MFNSAGLIGNLYLAALTELTNPLPAQALTRSNKWPIQARTSSPKQRHINTQNIVGQIVVYRVKPEIYKI